MQREDYSAMNSETETAVESMHQMDICKDEERATDKTNNTQDNDDDDNELPPLVGRDMDMASVKKAKASDDSDDDDDDISIPPLLGNPAEKSKAPTDDTSDTDSDDIITSPEEIEKRLIEAVTLKEQGNTAFKEAQLDAAARSYRRACNLLKKTSSIRLAQPTTSNENADTSSEQVTSVYLALQTNLSMVLFQQNKFSQSASVASQALQIDSNHVKALYRRAVARRATGDWDVAKQDLKRVLEIEPTNAACRKLLATIKKDSETSKENQKKALAKAFSKDGLLYQDKQAEERKREERARLKKHQEQDQYKKRKQEWEDDCVKRMSKDEPAISFEDWEKEQKEKEKAAKKEEDDRRKEREKQRKRELEEKRRREKLADSDSDDDDDEDKLTEKELAMMRGYKLTKDGRKTSYFTRELSEDEKKVYADVAPKRLDSTTCDEDAVALAEPSQTVTSTTSSSLSLTASSSVTSGSMTTAATTSAWNAAGTWEEKDTTIWCTEQLRQRLNETTVTTEHMEVDVVEIKTLTGHASVALAAGRKRYIFEYEADLKYEMKDTASDKVVASGFIRLPDIESTSHDELEVTFGSWKKKPSVDLQDRALVARNRLAEQLRLQVQQWVDEFNTNY